MLVLPIDLGVIRFIDHATKEGSIRTSQEIFLRGKGVSDRQRKQAKVGYWPWSVHFQAERIHFVRSQRQLNHLKEKEYIMETKRFLLLSRKRLRGNCRIYVPLCRDTTTVGDDGSFDTGRRQYPTESYPEDTRQAAHHDASKMSKEKS